jgi:phage/plasmid-associated DNA primase
MFAAFVEWLGSEEDATSLLHHLATTLVTTWPAVRYVLLIGEGRNGKSLIMKMLVDLFGQRNVSHVTRQQMSSKAPECHDLTNKLLNVVFDGEATYLKDSGMEKTLTAGEVAQIRKLFETYPTPVQTNGLFIEGLNREPRSSDKSSALQKRIVRFHLPNTYELDHRFEQRMRSPRMLGALLGLLLDHYVRAEDVREKLAPTATSIELKLEHSMVNSMALQFLAWMDTEDALGADGLLNENLPAVAERFKYWRLQSNDISPWSTADVESMLRPLFLTDRQSQRVNGKPRKVRVITGFKPEVVEFLDYHRGKEVDHVQQEALVDERSVLEVELDAADSVR